MTAFNPMASEHKRGKDGLFACCNTVAEPMPPAGMGIKWQKTRRPATSPEMGTPAWQAWAGAGEEVWEPVFILRR